MPYPSAQAVYTAASRWRDESLINDRSLFGGPHGTTLALGEELLRDVVGQPDANSDSFMTKLSGQLRTSSPGAVQLAAELLYVYCLVARSDSFSGSKKRALVDQVLGYADGTTPMPGDLSATLETGLVRTGTAYGSYRHGLFRYLVEFVILVKQLPLDERVALLADPLAFTTALKGLDGGNGGAMQRYSLEHLLFPDTFCPALSADSRDAILTAWPQHSGSADLNQSLRLADLYKSLAAERGAPDEFISMWRSPFQWEWSAISDRWSTLGDWTSWVRERISVDADEREYKLAAVNQLRDVAAQANAGDTSWTDALAKVFRSTNLVSNRAYEEFITWIRADEPAARSVTTALWNDPEVAALDTFAQALPDDVLAQQGARLSVSSFLRMIHGVQDQPPWRARYTAAVAKLAGCRTAQQGSPDSEVYDAFLVLLDFLGDLMEHRGEPLEDRLDAQSLIWTLAEADDLPGVSEAEFEALGQWRAGKQTRPLDVLPEIEPVQDIPTVSITTLDDESLADLAAALFVDVELLTAIDELARDRNQVIFTGSPGTGKTYIARRYAQWLAGSDDRVRLVQLHPSYGYEDFVEGYRPSGQGYILRDGPLKTMALRAAADPGHNYVLIIDELNRGNAARVFGELYFLLEYRDTEAQLMYSDAPFALPANLFLIGTMNSADRSIAILDSALRRRFSFVEFDPTRPPLSEVLTRFLAAHAPQHAWAADLVRRANEIIDDPAAAIGPSHFLRTDLTEQVITRVWNHDVLPTLREQLWGQTAQLAALELEALRGQVRAGDVDVDDPAD